MKKSTKIILGTIAGLFLTGLLLLLIGVVAGGRNQAMDIIREDAHISGSFGGWISGLITEEDDEETDNDSEEEADLGLKEIDATEKNNADERIEIADGSKFNSLALSMGAGEFVIRESADDKVYLSDVKKLSVKTALKGDTLYVKAKPKTKRLWNFVNTVEGGTLVIYLPQKEYNQVDLELGAGELKLEQKLIAKEIELSLGAGEITGTHLQAEKLQAEVSAGSMTLVQINAGRAEIEVSAGECVVEKASFEKLSVDVAMGSAEIGVDGKEEDTSYEAECSMGEVRIGKNVYLHQGTHDKDDAQGEKKRHIDAECGMGEISITFHE